MILYGISNCDTVKKAKNWLESNNLDYRFHDFRKQGLEPEIIQDWLTQISWDKLLNKRSTTWRNLESEVQQSVNAVSSCFVWNMYRHCSPSLCIRHC